MIVVIIYLALIILMVASIWKTFEKAGQPGWAAIVPFYNIYILTVIAEKPAWWIVMFFLPILNIVFSILLFIEIAKKFGKDSGFGIGLALLGIVFWPMLGFGSAEYQGNTRSNGEILDVA